MSAIVCYISGHGFGHAVRVAEVLRALHRLCPDVALHIRTRTPRWFIEPAIEAPATHTAVELDVGAVQRDSLTVDPEATLKAYAMIVAQKKQRIAAEVTALASLRPSLIFADIPALAFDVAARLGVPGVGMTNFSWDWIYADYVRDLPAYAPVVEDLRASYGFAQVLLRLPFHGALDAFRCIRDIPLVARHARLPRAATRRRLALPAADRIVVLSFGGIGVNLVTVPSPPPGVTFVATQSATDGIAAQPGCRFISNRDMARREVRYEDLVAAADVVITKPGYGIVADCIANGTPMLYTSRGRFAEYACLVDGIEAHLPHAFISNEDLYAGCWTAALDAVLSQPRQTPNLSTNGAQVAADALADLLRDC